MDIVWQQPLGMKNFKKATTTVEEYLEQVNLLQ
jgi:hypothetical protein